MRLPFRAAFIFLVCRVAISLKFERRDSAVPEDQQKWQDVVYVSDDQAKRKETEGGTQKEEACYSNHLGCFKVGNSMTQGDTLPRSPSCVQSVIKLLSPSTPQKPLILNYADNRSVEDVPDIDTIKGIKILFHGFNQGGASPWIQQASTEFTKLGFIVIVVDWSRGQSLVKPKRSAPDTAMVGREASAVLRLLITRYPEWIHPSLTHAIGFSMGAHAAGFFCRHFNAMTGQKIARLTGLDPASIYFEDKRGHMNQDDAAFVDVIHTSAGNQWWRTKVGFTKPLGHVDFYPNGGSTQPGCRWTLYPCSHQRAWRLFLASITHRERCKFYTWICPRGYEQAMEQTCPYTRDLSTRGRLGYYSNTEPGRGVQYLHTTKHEPYCEN